MKSEPEVEAYKAEAAKRVYACSKCEGNLGSDCECVHRFLFNVDAFEACIPRDFWSIQPSDVEFNTEAFKRYVLPYTEKLTKAHRNGYGLLFSGANGVGKTMFMSFILARAIRRGKSAYYTTMLQLDHDIKRGFNDPSVQERLDWMLTSDFLGLDEMGKEQFKAINQSSNFMKAQIERILKQRFDESKPVLMATNLSTTALGKAYGDTVLSIINGKYQQVIMEPGDIRKRLAERMAADMGFDE